MSNALTVCHGSFGRAALYQLDRPFVTHAHREGHLVFYVGGAHATVRVRDFPVRCTEQCAAAVSPWEPHSFLPSRGAPSLCLVLYIKPMWFLENSSSAQYAMRFGQPVIRMTDRLSAMVQRLTQLMLQDDGMTDYEAFLLDITRTSFDQSWQHCTDQSHASVGLHFSDYRVRRSLRLFKERLSEDIDMEDYARDVGLSRPHFFKLFKRQMGVTPCIYLNTLRTEQAIEDLITTIKSVTDIGYDLGFSSQASFTRFFSSNVGIAPTEYRRVSIGQ